MDSMSQAKQARSNKGTFMQIGNEPLSRKTRATHLPESVDRIFERIPKNQRSKWMRDVLVKALLEYEQQTIPEVN